MCWELPLDVFCTKVGFAQKAYFAKSRERLKLAVPRLSISAARPVKAAIDALCSMSRLYRR
jgi:hypothetical protein